VTKDAASAYERHAREFLSHRDSSSIGIDVVRRWAQSLEAGTDVLEIGCGGGLPVTRALLEADLEVRAIDASPTLVAEFQKRFPATPVQCQRIQDSDYFGQQFGAVVAIGLVFLLDEQEQHTLIRRVADSLVPKGRFLFTAPAEVHNWEDLTTGHACQSLGQERYTALLQECGCHVVGQYEDEGNNNYYDVQKDAG
jgi:cyclopropane fatty-acyl-phospholipid synthase-like methyltransferase